MKSIPAFACRFWSIFKPVQTRNVVEPPVEFLTPFLNQRLICCFVLRVFVWMIISLVTHQVPLLVPHGIIKQLIHWAVPAPSEGRPLIAAFLVLLLCPQHLQTGEKTRPLKWDKMTAHRTRKVGGGDHSRDHPPTAAWWCGWHFVSFCRDDCGVWTRNGLPGPRSAERKVRDG